MKHKDHFNKSNHLNQNWITEFFCGIVVKVKNLNQHLITLLKNISLLNSKDEPLTPHVFMNIASEMMNFLDLNDAY